MLHKKATPIYKRHLVLTGHKSYLTVAMMCRTFKSWIQKIRNAAGNILNVERGLLDGS